MGYSPSHKGFKHLDPSSSRVYISSDVIFDEALFPFAKMHENAGRRFQTEINLLPSSILNPNTFDYGASSQNDHVSNSPFDSTNPCEGTANF